MINSIRLYFYICVDDDIEKLFLLVLINTEFMFDVRVQCNLFKILIRVSFLCLLTNIIGFRLSWPPCSGLQLCMTP
jgi:hypothetical protein